MAEGGNTSKGRQNQERTTTYLDLSVLRSTKDTARAALAMAIVAIILCGGLAAYTHNALQKMGATDSQSQEQAASLTEQMTSRLDGMDTAVDQRLSTVSSDMEQRIAALEQSMAARLRSVESQAMNPKQVTQQINAHQARSALLEVSAQAETLGSRIEDPQIQAKLVQVRKLLNELEQGLRK